MKKLTTIAFLFLFLINPAFSDQNILSSLKEGSKIIFIRHAETQWNLLGLIQGHTDIPICKDGEINARKWKINSNNYILWSSPLKRATQTAEIVFFKKPKIEKALIERIGEIGKEKNYLIYEKN